MRIIKPYGRSFTERGNDGLVRKLRDNQVGEAHSISEFVTQHDELIIAQWISIIDKIATKPFKGDATTAQRTLRSKIGDACWLTLVDKELLQSPVNNERKAFLEQLWDFKIHPYGDKEQQSAHRRPSSKTGNEQNPKGRWYSRFVGNLEIEAVNGSLVASAIYQYLHKDKGGAIQARAKSIEGNVLKQRQPEEQTWDDATLGFYSEQADIAEVIHGVALQLERDNKKVGTRMAAQCLYEHWPKVFINTDGSIMNIEQARSCLPELFDLHTSIKDAYSRLLENHRAAPKTQAAASKKKSMLLPKNKDELSRLIGKQQQNRELASLVRLGKILHYTASDKVGLADTPALVGENWPTLPEVQNSRYWGSEGQAEIKRNEAFVRIWRGVISHAQRNFTDWAAMKPIFSRDILVAPISAIIDDARNFDTELFDKKATLLFGREASLFTQSDDDRKSAFKSTHTGLGSLRNASFHFKGRGQFIDNLSSLATSFEQSTRAQVEQLWLNDRESQQQSLIEQLRGVHCETYLSIEQSGQLLALVRSSSTSRNLPLPRFSRVLKRAENAWKRSNLNRLPKTGNSNTFQQHPELLCQYVCLKLLYEKSFRDWLELCDSSQVNTWFDNAVKRSNEAAKQLNKSTPADLVRSRMSSLNPPQSGVEIKRFFFDLSAATASEMRVQRGYENDADNAKAQAGYIDDVLCDVVLLALNDYLNQKDLKWVFSLPIAKPNESERKCQLDTLTLAPINHASVEPWQAPLYFLLHLVPIEEIGRLSHQLTKWEVTAGREQDIHELEARRLHHLMAVLDLYLSQHDAKFIGELELTGVDTFKSFFADQQDFDRVFPRADELPDQRLIPKRKLREISRFGHAVLVKALNNERLISSETVSGSLETEQVASAQGDRQVLHEKWSTQRRNFGAEDYKNYCYALSKVVQYRQLNAEATLSNHLQAHRLVMSVLGRLVDYAGLFERGLYFVTLASLHDAGLKPEDFFSNDGNQSGLNRFSEGRLLDALTKLQERPEADGVVNKLKTLFGDINCNDPGSVRNIRNNLAHFNMLAVERDTDSLKSELDLTDIVNKTRRLMSYDRKLKNAVTQSVKELLARDGIALSWKMSSNHQLIQAQLSSRVAGHLGNTKLVGRKVLRIEPLALLVSA